MPYVERSEDGTIIALYNAPTDTAREYAPLMTEDVLAFLKACDSKEQLMAYSDLASVRILEDLIDILVRKNIIQFTELPEQARQRILNRQRLRRDGVPENLLVDEII